MRKHSQNRSKSGYDFKWLWLFLEVSANLLKLFPLIIVIESITKQQLNKERTVSFQIITWRDRIRERKYLVRDTDDTKYTKCTFSFFCLTSMTKSFLKLRKANEKYLDLLFGFERFFSSICTLYDKSLS